MSEPRRRGMTGRARTFVRAVLGAGMAVLLAAPALHAQTPTRATVDSLRAQIVQLRVQLDSLRALVRTLSPVAGARPAADTAMDPLARIRALAAAAAGGAAADTAAAPPPQATEFVGRQRNLSQLNPEISVTGDLLAFANRKVAGSDNFVPREFEFAFQSNLDPYSRAKIFVSHHTPGGELVAFPDTAAAPEEGGTEVEEGYAEWLNLPAGFSVTVGKFRQRFGTLNRWHPHALPGQQLPLPYTAFFGEEGLVQAGLSTHWLVPVHGAGTYEVWGQVTRDDNPLLFGDSHRVSGLLHLNSFWQLSRATYFELGLTGLTGGYRDADTGATFGRRVAGLDFTVDWRPPARALYREATLRGGVVLNHAAGPVAPVGDAWGGFLIGEYKLGQRWIAGTRYEYTENPLDPAQHSWLLAPTLTWWQSEFVRLRAEYDFLQHPNGRLGQFLIQTTFAMGPHKHETY